MSKNFQHARALADHAVEFQIGEQLLFEVANLPALREEAGQLVQGFQQSREIERLAEIIVSAVLDRLNG